MSATALTTDVYTPSWWERCLLQPWPDGLYRLGGGTSHSMTSHLLDRGDHEPTLWQTLGYAYWPDGTWRPGNRLWGVPESLRD